MTNDIKVYFVCSSIFMMVLSCNSPDFNIQQCLAKKYGKKELDLFYQSGFYNNEKIKKWRNDIKISFEGEPTIADIAYIDSLIMEFQPLISPIGIERVKRNGNVKFSFVKLAGGQRGQAIRRPRGKFSSEFLECKLLINPIFLELDRRKTMRHEFMHALGMEHPPYNYKESTILGSQFYKSLDDLERLNRIYHRIGGLDESLVRMLYENCVPAGLTRKEFETEMEALVKENQN